MVRVVHWLPSGAAPIDPSNFMTPAATQSRAQPAASVSSGRRRPLESPSRPRAPRRAESALSQSTPVSAVTDPLPASDEVGQPVSSRADGAALAASEPQSRMTLATICELEDPPFGLVAARLQGCIDIAPPFSSVEIPRGFYLLETQVVIRKPLTIRTVGSA